MVANAKRKKRDVTVVGGNLISMTLPGGRKGLWEMLSPDELLTRKGWRVYREMLADDQVKASLEFKKMLIVGRSWDIDPASDSEQDKEIARFIQKNFEKAYIKKLMKEALSCLEYGFCAGEILWNINDDLKLELKTIKFRDPEFMRIQVNKGGDIKNFVQRPMVLPKISTKEINIEPSKVFHYAHNYSFSNHYGISDLRAAYRAWWSKKYVTQFWNVFLERFGAPLMKTTYPQGASESLKTALKKIMTNLSSKTDILVPEGVVIELIEATRAGTAQYDVALTYYDIRIAVSILVPALLGMGTDIKRGSDSQSRLHLRTLMKVVQFLGDELATELNTKVIRQIVDANWTVKEYPKFIWQDYGEFESFEISDAVKELFAAGLIDADQEDVNFLRSILGLQVRGEGNEDDIIRTDPPPIGNPPGNDPLGGQAGPGNKRAQKSPSTRVTNKRTGQRRN